MKGTAKVIAVVFIYIHFIKVLISEVKNKGKKRVPLRGFN